MILEYTILYYRGHGPEQIKGSLELRPGANVVAPELPKAKLWSVKASLRRSPAEG